MNKKEFEQSIADLCFVSDASETMQKIVQIKWEKAIEISKGRLLSLEEESDKEAAELFVNSLNLMVETKKKLQDLMNKVNNPENGEDETDYYDC